MTAFVGLVLGLLVADGCDDAGPGGSDAIDWGGACEEAVCARICGGGARRGACVADECVCTCDQAACEDECFRYYDSAGHCLEDETCGCECHWGCDGGDDGGGDGVDGSDDGIDEGGDGTDEAIDDVVDLTESD
jgi:hypothetical protein